MPLFARGIPAEVRPCIPTTANTAAGKLADKRTACLSGLRTAEGLCGGLQCLGVLVSAELGRILGFC